MNPISKKDTLATDFFQRRVNAITSDALERVTAEIDSLSASPQGEALFMSFERDPRALELFGADMALRQVVEIFKALFSSNLSPEDALSAGAAQGPTINIELTPEARRREYESLLPGPMAKLPPDQANFALGSVSQSQSFIFSDGSALIISEPDPDSVRMSALLLSQADSLADLCGKPGSRSSDLAETFRSMTSQIKNEILSQSQSLTLDDIEARSDEVSFQAIKSILSSGVIVAPMDSLRSMMESVSQRMSEPETGAWSPGVTVRLDDAKQDTPAALLDALPTPDLDASRQADELIASVRNKSRGPK